MLAQAKQRDRQLAKMEEEGLIADPDAKSDEATIALRFPPPPPLKKPLLASLDGASFRYPTPGGTLAKGASSLDFLVMANHHELAAHEIIAKLRSLDEVSFVIALDPEESGAMEPLTCFD